MQRSTTSAQPAQCYDHHFDPLCLALGIESVWVAEPGSID